MPFISKDWRSPGEEWVRYEGGWEKKSVVTIASDNYNFNLDLVQQQVASTASNKGVILDKDEPVCNGKSTASSVATLSRGQQQQPPRRVKQLSECQHQVGKENFDPLGEHRHFKNQRLQEHVRRVRGQHYFQEEAGLDDAGPGSSPKNTRYDLFTQRNYYIIYKYYITRSYIDIKNCAQARQRFLYLATIFGIA